MKRKTSALAAILFAGLLSWGLVSRPARSAEALDSPSRSFEFSSIVHVPAIPVGSKELRLWIPLPYEETYQSVSDLKIESPFSYHIEREKQYGNRYAYIVVSAAKAQAPFDIRVSFHIQRFEHRVSLDGKNEPPDRPAIATTRFLQPDRLVPINGVIENISQQETQGVTA
ncbi:MAG: hypothetical protein WB621_03520, partial [Candidatus Acidiferrales bacterium]